jgi:uncharacterized membrane protein YbhN (UPF0104 family)
MDKLNYVLDISNEMIRDLESECKHIETKLHNFIYVLLTIAIGIITLICATINVFNQYVTTESYYLFFGFNFLSIIRIFYSYFKVWVYDESYSIITDINAYKTYCDTKNDTLENLMRVDLNAKKNRIENNSKLNNVRNCNLNQLKIEFKYYLYLLVILSTIIFILN